LSVLFVSDLHLDEARPAITDLFLRFLHDEGRKAQAVYVLGDLFEAWVGDDDDGELATRVAAGLRAAADAGARLSFIRGNRDFLVGQDYAARCGMALLPDPCVVGLHGEPTLLLHGDLLCSDDLKYLEFRRQVREPAWQAQFLAQPLAARQAFAKRARAESSARQQGMPLDIGDATQAAVDEMFARFGVRRMIHGHTHRPAVHDGSQGQRIVLGDWYEQGSVLRLDDAGRYALSALAA
jgi:UDP-2,3-diacylglucosamine hydrolase